MITKRVTEFVCNRYENAAHILGKFDTCVPKQLAIKNIFKNGLKILSERSLKDGYSAYDFITYRYKNIFFFNISFRYYFNV